MKGLIGVGLGVAVGFGAMSDGAPVGLVWCVLAVSLGLVYLWGRSHGKRGYSIAVARSTAVAASDATAVSSSNVTVVVGPRSERALQAEVIRTKVLSGDIDDGDAPPQLTSGERVKDGTMISDEDADLSEMLRRRLP